MSLKKKIILLNKKIGQTPLQALEKFKEKHPKYNKEKLAYAGRLDPMAEGLLLVLVGEECKEREKYQNLSKDYEFEVIFGLSTDSYDILGLLQENKKVDFEKVDKNITNILKKYKGEVEQEYPIFSSKAVKGKKLFQWYKEGKIQKIKIPSKRVKINKIEFIKKEEISKNNLEENIYKRINLVKGDFRQEKILEKWKDYFQKSNINSYKLYKFKAEVSSGTYIRGLIDRIGNDLGIGALAYSIKRTKIEKFKL